ncbi:MAG: adenosine kinase [Microthrixaceae bacterium]
MNTESPSQSAGNDIGTSDPTIDVLGIGNALVDVLSHQSDEFVESIGVVKGAMTLIDEDDATRLYDTMGPGIEVSGGSGANTVVGVAALGGTAAYIGKVRDDQLGDVFGHDLRATGVRYDVAPAADGPSTGRCLILVTPDAQRTMNTYLGASACFESDDVDPDAIRSAAVVYLEGYLFDGEAAQDAFRSAAQIAHDAGRRVAVTLSDPFCVERHREAFLDLVESHVDLVFANELEACSLYECGDVETAAKRFSATGAIAVITRSEKGCLIVDGENSIAVPASPVDQVIDTTGAGDLFAAGFLVGYSRGYDLDRCASIGAIAAAEVISHIGARPQADLAGLASHLL